MTSYLSRLSPVPCFPDYSGPHKVGTIDVELPVSELESPSPAPDETIATVQYRVFYPCEPQAKGTPVTWIPSPQRGYVSAYTRFLGAGSWLADMISYFPGLINYISIPVQKNAPLLQPTTSDGRWPVMIFSHGLGGSRNAYSHLVGSIASHGVIVVAPEHRDGSAPISYIRDVPSGKVTSEKTGQQQNRRTITYIRMSHTPSPEVEQGRTQQLKIRLWELGLVHDSLLKLDLGKPLTNLNTSCKSLSSFQNLMNVHEPGKTIFAGHSFGAATMTQFVKSTFYSPRTSSAPKEYEPIFTPSSRSAIVNQITPESPVILLDVWCLPLRASTTRWLWNLPFPCYSKSGPGGSALLAVESQAFYKWRVHLKSTKRLLSPNPTSDICDYGNERGTAKVEQPYFYYASTSAHLSQSDFGVLFSFVAKRVLKVNEPHRIIKLNVRAILQLLREQGIEVGATIKADMELGGRSIEGNDETGEDTTIFSKTQEISGWNRLTTDLRDLGDVDDEAAAYAASKEETSNGMENGMNGMAGTSKAVLGNELKPTEVIAERL